MLVRVVASALLLSLLPLSHAEDPLQTTCVALKAAYSPCCGSETDAVECPSSCYPPPSPKTLIRIYAGVGTPIYEGLSKPYADAIDATTSFTSGTRESTMGAEFLSSIATGEIVAMHVSTASSTVANLGETVQPLASVMNGVKSKRESTIYADLMREEMQGLLDAVHPGALQIVASHGTPPEIGFVTTFPVSSVSDLAGKTFRSKSWALNAILESVGSTVVGDMGPLGEEGGIDGYEFSSTPLTWAFTSGLMSGAIAANRSVYYYSVSFHSNAVPAYLVANKATYDSMTPFQKWELVSSTATASDSMWSYYDSATASALQEMREAGITVVTEDFGAQFYADANAALDAYVATKPASWQAMYQKASSAVAIARA